MASVSEQREDWTRHFAREAQRRKDQLGLTVRDLAAQTGLPVMSVHRAVTTGNVLLSSALRIGLALGMHVGDFMDIEVTTGAVR